MAEIVVNPNKMSDDVVKKLEEAFLMDCTVEEACFSANITKQTYYNWVKSFPDLLERFNSLRENPVYVARRSVMSGIEKDPELALKYLERKKKAEFSLRTELGGIDGKDLIPDDNRKEQANGLIKEYLNDNTGNTIGK